MRHRVYDALLDVLSLEKSHRLALLDRTMAESTIDRWRLRSVPKDQQHVIAEAVMRKTELSAADLRTVPGFRWWSAGDGGEPRFISPAGILLPVVGPDGNIASLQVRRDKADDNTPRYLWVTSASAKENYEPGPRAVLSAHCPPFNGDRTTSRLTEGPIKAELAQQHTGMWTVGVPGVGMWEFGLEAMQAAGVKAVRLAFDSDWRDNRQVACAMANCARRIVALGLALELETWEPSSGKGIDDVLADGGQPDVLVGVDAVKAILDAAGRHDLDSGPQDAADVVPWISWYVDHGTAEALYADAGLLKAAARIKRSGGQAWAQIETRVKAARKFTSITTFRSTVADIAKGLAAQDRKATGRGASPRENYVERDGCLYRQVAIRSEQGEKVEQFRIAQFTARIIEEVAVHDRGEVRRQFHIEAERAAADGSGVVRGRAEVDATDFDAMGWVHEQLGASWIIEAGRGTKDHVRAAIQEFSNRDGIGHSVTHCSTGWIEHEGDPFYLHAGGAIGNSGQADVVKVNLPGPLRDYSLPSPDGDRSKVERAIRACYGLLDLGGTDRPAADHVAAVVSTLPWRAVLGPCDFVVHFSGGTGSFKSSCARLAMQHFAGVAGGALHQLPASWTSTGNSLAGLAYDARDTLLVIDEMTGEHAVATATSFIQSQGNLKTRDRMTRDLRHSVSLDPRGAVLSTGEADPSRQSTLARMLTVKMARGTITPDRLSRCQQEAADGMLALAMAEYLKHLASDGRLAASRRKLREDARRIAGELAAELAANGIHARQPGIAGDLLAGFGLFLEWVRELGLMEPVTIEAWSRAIRSHMLSLLREQASIQAESRPGRRFLGLLHAALSSGKYHLADADSHNAPGDYAQACGWRKEFMYQGSDIGQSLEWKIPANSKGAGYIRRKAENMTVYLEPTVAKEIASRTSAAMGERFEHVANLGREMADAGIIKATKNKDGGWRYTGEPVTIHGSRKRYFEISVAALFGDEDSTDDTE